MQTTMFSKVAKSSLARRYWKRRYLFIMLLPALIFLFTFKYGPMLGIQIAFKDYAFRKGIWGSPWVGFKHFESLFRMRSFGEVFGNTIIISVYKLLFGFPAPILFAVLLSELRLPRFKRVVQTVSYLPHFVSWVILGSLFRQLLSPTIGPFAAIANMLDKQPVGFLTDTRYFRTVLVLTSVWKGFGWGSIVYLAAITGIDPQLYEAAEIDGATRIQKICHITLPSIVPVITIMLIFAIGNLVDDDFDQIFNLYNSAVYSVGDVLGTYTYRKGLIEMKYDLSTAVGLFRNVLSFALVMGTNAVAKRINDYGIW